MSEEIDQAAATLKSGGIVIFPTETVYGIGCLIGQNATISRLYQLKNRESKQPTLVLVKDLDMAQEYVSFNDQALKLSQAFWPGPLTLALPCDKNVPENLLGPGKSLAVRVSSNIFIKALFEEIDQPLLAPSANLKGEPAPTKQSEIDKALADEVDYVVPIEPEGLTPSTILNFDLDGYNIVREGSITKEQIDQLLN